jgi:hypothetical protein
MASSDPKAQDNEKRFGFVSIHRILGIMLFQVLSCRRQPLTSLIRPILKMDQKALTLPNIHQIGTIE